MFGCCVPCSQGTGWTLPAGHLKPDGQSLQWGADAEGGSPTAVEGGGETDEAGNPGGEAASIDEPTSVAPGTAAASRLARRCSSLRTWRMCATSCEV